MSIFGADPGFLGRIFPQTAHMHTHQGHLMLAIIGAALGGLVGWALPWTGWLLGYQVGAGVMGAFYLIREIEAHRFYRRELRSGRIGAQAYRVHIWDSRMDVLVPWCFVGPVVTIQWPAVVPLWLALWALVMVLYITRPEGQAGGMR